MRCCLECGEPVLFDWHACARVWQIWYEDHYGDECVEVRGYYAETALEKWAEEYDRDGYLLLNGQTIEVGISHEGGEITKYTISGKSVPTYTATEIDQPKATGESP